MRKEANLIIIGGTIAAGKSTLVNGISKAKGFRPVPELRDGDQMQEIILKKLYEGVRIHAPTIQYYFVANRYEQYKEVANGLVTSILDRGIWEDWFFALLLLSHEKKSYQHFIKLWKSIIQESLDLYGYPKAYIYVKVDWENFKKRIFLRGRNSEIRNFSENENYFRNLLHQYVNNFENLLLEWGIKPITIDTISLSEEEVIKVALSELEKLGV